MALDLDELERLARATYGADTADTLALVAIARAALMVMAVDDAAPTFAHDSLHADLVLYAALRAAGLAS